MQELAPGLNSKPSTSCQHNLFDRSVEVYICCIHHVAVRTSSHAATGQYHQQQHQHSNLWHPLFEVGQSFLQCQKNQRAAVRVSLKAVKEPDTAIKRTDGLWGGWTPWDALQTATWSLWECGRPRCVNMSMIKRTTPSWWAVTLSNFKTSENPKNL